MSDILRITQGAVWEEAATPEPEPEMAVKEDGSASDFGTAGSCRCRGCDDGRGSDGGTGCDRCSS